MTQAQRERARFYASLASIANFDDLKEWERLKLEEELQRVIFPFIVDPNVDIRIFQQELAASLRGSYRPPALGGRAPVGVSDAEAGRRLAKDLLPHISGLVQDLTRLLDGQAVLMHRVLLGVWTLRDGVFTESQKERSTDGKMRRDLYDLFREKPFPFRRCPVCQTIFVPVRRQLYCTPTCTYKGTEMARKEEKREYMRDYMEKRRKKAKRKIHLVNKEKEG